MVGSYLYLKARPALVQRDQGLAQHLAGGGGGNAGGVQCGGQLVQVCTDDVGLGHSADGIQQLQKAYAASFRGTGTPEAGGVSFLQLLDAIRTVTKANIIGADLNELAPTLDTTGVSTATACKVLRETLIALDKGWPGFQV